MNTKYYHYSSSKIDNKESIDFSKCENGFWATSISPDMLEEHGDEIGFNDATIVHEIIINEEENYEMVDQNTAEGEIKESGADYGVLRYDNGEIEFEDVVFFSSKAIVSISRLVS